MNKGETIAIGWIDDGMVYSDFMDSVLNLIEKTKDSDNPIVSHYKFSSALVDVNRNKVIDQWFESDVDWMIWIDTDVVIPYESFKFLVDNANKDSIPVLSGIYVGYRPGKKPSEVRLSINTKEEFEPYSNQVLPLDSAALGLTIIHRSIIEKFKQHSFNGGIHGLRYSDDGEVLVGEDVSFFVKLKELGIPAYFHTSAIGDHLKMVRVNIDFYNRYK
jgi:hypothetical protein